MYVIVEDAKFCLCFCYNLPLFLNRLQFTRIHVWLHASTCNFIKKQTLAQVLSCEFCEIFKNIFFFRKPTVAASDDS